MKRNISVVVAGALIIVCLGVVTGQEYRAYQNREHARVNAANAQLREQQSKGNAAQAVLQDRASKLYEQCKLGESTYKLLPVAIQAKNAAPVCGLPIVQ